MGEYNPAQAALEGAAAYVGLRDAIVDLLSEGMKWSYDDQEIHGHAATAEAIIAFFAERLTTPTPETTTDGEGGVL